MVTKKQLSEILSGYNVMGEEEGECFEVEDCSPAGEDVILTLWGKDLRAMADYADAAAKEDTTIHG